VELNLSGVSGLDAASAIIMKGNPDDENSISEPRKVAPSTETVDATQSPFNYTFPPNSLSVIRFDVKDD
jgi:alpha-L-arabinofuranosidase